MCDHKNLKTINDMLICKDCGQQLPLSFLTDRGKTETENEAPAPDVLSETPPETGDEQEPDQEPEQELEKEPEQETEQEPEQEPAETDENPAENQPVEVKTDKSSSAKKPRKNAKKGA